MVAAPGEVVDQTGHGRGPDGTDEDAIPDHDVATGLASVRGRSDAAPVGRRRRIPVPAAGIGVDGVVRRGGRSGVRRRDGEDLEHHVREVDEGLELLVPVRGRLAVELVLVRLTDDDVGGGRVHDARRTDAPRTRDRRDRVAVLAHQLLDEQLARLRRRGCEFPLLVDVHVVATGRVPRRLVADDRHVEVQVGAPAERDARNAQGRVTDRFDVRIRRVPDQRRCDVGRIRRPLVADANADGIGGGTLGGTVRVEADHVPGDDLDVESRRSVRDTDRSRRTEHERQSERRQDQE